MAVHPYVLPWRWAQEALGTPWPKGDEDKLRDVAGAWKEAADWFVAEVDQGSQATANVDSVVQSKSADDFTAFWNEYVKSGGSFDQLAKECSGLADYANSGALQIEGAKYAMNTVAIMLYAQIAWALAQAAFTFGGSTLELPAFIARSRIMQNALLRNLIMSIAFTVAPDLVSQSIQIAKGERSGYDGKQLGMDLFQGVVMGGAMHGFGLGTGKLTERFGTELAATPLGGLALAGVNGAGANLATNTLMYGIGLSSQNPLDNLGGTLANGAFMGTMFHGAEAFKSTKPLMLTTADGTNVYLTSGRLGRTPDPTGATDLTVYTSSPGDPSRATKLGIGALDASGRVTVDTGSGTPQVFQSTSTPTAVDAYYHSPLNFVRKGAAPVGSPNDPNSMAAAMSGTPDPTGTHTSPDVLLTGPDGKLAAVATPGADPAAAAAGHVVTDPLGRTVDPGTVHTLGTDSAGVVVAGDGHVTPPSLDRPLATNEAMVYDLGKGNAQNLVVFHDPNADFSALKPEQIPSPGEASYFSPNGKTFLGKAPVDPTVRPDPSAFAGNPEAAQAAHARAQAGIGKEAPTADPRLPGTSQSGAGDSLRVGNQAADSALTTSAKPKDVGALLQHADEQRSGTQNVDDRIGTSASMTAAADPASGRSSKFAALLRNEDLAPRGETPQVELAGVGAHENVVTDAHVPGSGSEHAATHHAQGDQGGSPSTHGTDAALPDPEARPTDRMDIPAQVEWARDAFDAIGQAGHDVDAVHEAVAHVTNPDGTPKYSRDDIQQVKDHLFVDSHPLDDGHGGIEDRRFDADPEVVQSWLRLASGAPEPHDLLLLDHELAEAAAYSADPSISHEEAHRRANLVADYESTLPERERQALYDYFEGNHGDPGLLREGGRGPADDPLSMGRQPGRDGPLVGAGEGDRTAAAGTGAADHPAHGDSPQDLHAQGEHGHLAGAGHDGELIGVGAGHDGGHGRPFQSGAALGRRGGRGRGGRDASARFDHRQLVQHEPELWQERATELEVAIGAADFHDPAVRESIADAVVKMRDALRILNDPHPGESEEDFHRRIDTVFFRDQPSAAGNVGFKVTFDELLAHGDPRELMTALWNASYINAQKPREPGTEPRDPSMPYVDGDRPEAFNQSLLRAAKAGDWARVAQAGIDPEVVKARMKWQQNRIRDLGRKAELSRLADRLTGGKNDQYIFVEDFFSTSSMVAVSDQKVLTSHALIRSKLGAPDKRSKEAQLELAHSAQDYADRGAPLGDLSKRYVQQYMDGPVDDPNAILPWREGLAVHDTDNAWTRAAQAAGMTTVDGVSPTTTKMLLVSDFLGFGESHQEQFLKGLMAWMLPGRDHSLVEIAMGAQMIGHGPFAGQPFKIPTDPVAFYQRCLDWHSESGPALDLQVPHHDHYVDLIKAGDLTELTQNSDMHGEVSDLVDSVRRQLTAGVLDANPLDARTDALPGEKTDPLTTLESWLRRHGVDPSDPAAVRAMADMVPEANLYAIGAYTLHMHPYMTAAVTMHSLADPVTLGRSEIPSRIMFNLGMKMYVTNYLKDLAAGRFPSRLPMALRPVFHTGDWLNAGAPKSPAAQRWLDAYQRYHDARAAHEPVDRIASLRRDLRRARQAIAAQIEPHLPALFDEVLVHSDMLQGALNALPTVGTQENPVWTFRGDGWGLMARLRYGGGPFVDMVARQFISTGLSHPTPLKFMDRKRPLYVAYRLTGHYARDISPFTVYKDTPEVLLPPGSVTRQARDESIIAEAMALLPELPENCKIIVMEEVPRA